MIIFVKLELAIQGRISDENELEIIRGSITLTYAPREADQYLNLNHFVNQDVHIRILYHVLSLTLTLTLTLTQTQTRNDLIYSFWSSWVKKIKMIRDSYCATSFNYDILN